MIYDTTGNIFNSRCEALVNPVNCVGVMGKGLALQFDKEYPRESLKYKKWCKKGNMVLGVPFIVKTDNDLFPDYIVHFPTKYHWRDKSKLESIRAGLEQLKENILELEIESVAIPPLGCGLGGLNWDDVKPIIIAKFDVAPVKVTIYNP